MQHAESRSTLWLRRYAVVVSASTVLLLIAGGLVTSTGSGLAVPDWPLSYGMLMPPMVGGILFEHGHRMIASGVGFLTVILTAWTWKIERRPWVRWLAAAALGSVIIQGALGGLTVLLLLPTSISASHATLAQMFFCITLALAFVLSRWWIDRPDGGSFVRPRGLIVIPPVVIFVQLILGSIMRHSDAALAVPDLPLAYGTIFPSLSDKALAGYTDQLVRLNYHLWADGQITAWQVGIHLAHRYWAILVSGVVAVTIIRLWAIPVEQARFRRLALLFGGAIVAQVTLGVLTVLEGRPIIIATAHQTLGALVLGLSVLVSLHVARVSAAANEGEKMEEQVGWTENPPSRAIKQ